MKVQNVKLDDNTANRWREAIYGSQAAPPDDGWLTQKEIAELFGIKHMSHSYLSAAVESGKLERSKFGKTSYYRLKKD